MTNQIFVEIREARNIINRTADDSQIFSHEFNQQFFAISNASDLKWHRLALDELEIGRVVFRASESQKNVIIELWEGHENPLMLIIGKANARRIWTVLEMHGAKR